MYGRQRQVCCSKIEHLGTKASYTLSAKQGIVELFLDNYYELTVISDEY